MIVKRKVWLGIYHQIPCSVISRMCYQVVIWWSYPLQQAGTTLKGKPNTKRQQNTSQSYTWTWHYLKRGIWPWNNIYCYSQTILILIIIIPPDRIFWPWTLTYSLFDLDISNMHACVWPWHWQKCWSFINYVFDLDAAEYKNDHKFSLVSILCSWCDLNNE